MATTNLKTQFISASFQNLLQISSSNNIFDGLGVQVNNLTVTASYVITAQTASYVQQSISASFAVTASYALYAVSASYEINYETSSSYAISASYATNAVSASYVPNTVSASYATTASYAATVNNAVTSQTASYSTTLGASINNFTNTAVSLGNVQLLSSNGSTISSTGHFSASYAFTASYAKYAANGGGGGGTPGGSSGQLQFNNAGAFGGTDTASTTYQFTGSLAISGSISGSSDTMVNFSNLGGGSSLGKFVIPTQQPPYPVHGTMYIDVAGPNILLYIYNGTTSTWKAVLLNI